MLAIGTLGFYAPSIKTILSLTNFIQSVKNTSIKYGSSKFLKYSFIFQLKNKYNVMCKILYLVIIVVAKVT